MKTPARFAATILATSALTISLAAAGPAAPATSSTTDRIANLVESVAPDQGSVVPGQLKSGRLLTKVNGAEISLPPDGRSALRLSDPETKKMGPLQVSLPTEIRSAAAKMANDGSVVYQSAGVGTDAVVQVLDDGSTRVQTVTHAPSASHEFNYKFGSEIVPVLEEDGTVSLTQSLDGVQVVRATVDKAWAKDATGKSVPTNYEVEGSTLRQSVLPQTDVAYPIVADPKIRMGVGIYLYLNKIEAREVKMAARGAAIIGSAVSCAVYVKKLKAIPGVKKLAAGLCAYVGPKGVQKLFTSASRVIIKNTPNCTQLRFRVSWSTKAVAKRNCQPLNKSWKW